MWPQWLRRQFSQLETLRPNWLHTTAYCCTLNTTATATTSLLPQQYQTDKTNSSSPWEINLLWRGKGESLEQVFLWGKPLDHFEQIFHFDTSSKDHNRTMKYWTWIAGRVAFEKLTDLDYKGETYYTIRCFFFTTIDDEDHPWLFHEFNNQLAFDDHPWFMVLIAHVSRRTSMIHD